MPRLSIVVLALVACNTSMRAPANPDAPTAMSVDASSSGRAALVAAPDGAGSACSERDPCSLEQVKVAAAAALSARVGDVVVELMDGTYPLTEPLRFGPEQSGQPGHPVVWRARPGAHPILSGAVEVRAWSKLDGGPDIWSAPVPATLRTRQIYVNGRRAPRAQGAPPVELVANADGYLAADDTYSRWRNPSQLEFVYPGGSGMWTEPRCGVREIDGRNVRMAQPCWNNATNRPKLRDPAVELPSMSPMATPSHIENAYELMQPGQFYLDEATHTVYYRTRANESLTTLRVEAPAIEQLIVGEGSLDAPIHDITFTGITFAHANWNGPSSALGFAEIQANITITGKVGEPPQGTCVFSDPVGTCPYGSYTREPGNIVWHGAEDVHFVDNRFEHMGASALVFEYGSHRNLVEGNVFSDISGIAVQIGDTVDPNPSDVGADDRETCSFNTISNNLISDIGAEFHGAVGIMLFYTKHTVVDHNEIHDVPYTGISSGAVGGHADTPASPDTTTSVNSDNKISSNLIYHYMTSLNDGGAIYIEGHQNETVYTEDGMIDADASYANGLKVTGNVAYFQGGFGNAFYDDIGSQWITWTGNVQWQASSGNGGCLPVGHLSFVDNYCSDPIADFGCGSPLDTRYARNARIPRSPAAADLPAPLLAQAGLQGEHRRLTLSLPPRLEYASSSVGQNSEETSVLIGGSGFSQDSRVAWAKLEAISVDILSSNFIVARAPANAQLSLLRVRTSQGTAALRINDTDPAVSYTGAWSAAKYPGNYDDESQHVAEENGAAFSYPFEGTGIEFISAMDRNRGTAEIYIDGKLVDAVSCKAPELVSQRVCARVSGLFPGQHTLKVIKTSGQYLTLDALNVID